MSAMHSIDAAIQAEVERINALQIPKQRYLASLDLQRVLQSYVPVLAEVRREALREERGYGYSLGDLAQEYGLTRARIGQLLDG